MFSWSWKKDSKKNLIRKTVSSAGADITKNTGKKTIGGRISKSRVESLLGAAKKKIYTKALTDFIETVEQHGLLNANDGTSTNLGSLNVEDNTWHLTRFPDGSATHLVLSRSKPYAGVNITRQSSKHLMQAIYKDLHEMSFNGLISSTMDLDPTLPGDIYHTLSEMTTHSVQTDLANRTREMMLVIESARLYHLYQTKGEHIERQHSRHIEDAVHTVRNAPDYHRRAEALASHEFSKRTRYGTFAREHGWMMLSILANSVAFRFACHSLDNDLWLDFNFVLAENSRSIEMFAKVRGLNWRAALTKRPHVGAPLTDADIRSTIDVAVDHPHNFTLPQEGNPRRPQHQGRDQVNIPANIYNPAVFASGPRPRSWPQGVAFPSDPSVRHAADGPCEICRSPTSCACRIETAILHPLVEITAYPGKGNGVRALQNIPADTIIGEYVGELHHSDSESDPTYSLEFSSMSGDRGVVATVHCDQYGNWTRYMNHSCNATAYFSPYVIGDRVRMCIRTTRQTEIFEEVTVDYGSGYWHERKLCQCGEPNCKYGTVEKVRETRARNARYEQRAKMRAEMERQRKLENVRETRLRL